MLYLCLNPSLCHCYDHPNFIPSGFLNPPVGNHIFDRNNILGNTATAKLLIVVKLHCCSVVF